ncbi:MAG: sigma-54-dependent Fis family transcriptional regulator [Myxococcales bacterium]|nr:sigma-54-dependent Fis family transcriptional regulator [Myxococcales bacterium]MCB9713848.1 sigma-54-dependent Fis family transcriptional regulator [Myxococcales bacterium]
MLRAIVIEDDPGFGKTLTRILEQQSYEVVHAQSVAEARRRIDHEEFDLALLDQHLPDGLGLTLLDEVVAKPNRPVVIMVTGAESLATTVQAIQRGAYDYFVKPPDLDALLVVIERAQRERELRVQLVQRRVREPSGAKASTRIDDIIVGSSPAMTELFKQIARVAPTGVNVLVTGESGSGKELVARAIHELGGRSALPFVAVNCAALSPTLVESELFGHARGAFTGATRDRPGRFELAGQGTLMLDEIGELELELQGKLLRAIEERTFERVGETRGRPFEARLVCATHRDLRRDVEDGRFREDLYFRLGVVQLHVPPLRERPDDILPIARHLLRQIGRQIDKLDLVIDPAAVELLRRYPWPGNVRELRNVMEHGAIMAQGVLTPDHLHAAGVREIATAKAAVPTSAPRTLADMERDHIRRTLEQLGWIKKAAAEALGISRPTLDRKIRLYRLEPSDE